jgi:uncharacterized repeat protein (TIGR01451 family)/fimbrial isopeptide formation D2 family protein
MHHEQLNLEQKQKVLVLPKRSIHGRVLGGTLNEYKFQGLQGGAMSMGIAFLNRVFRVLVAFLAFGITGIVVAQVCAVPGIDGNVTTGGILNTFYRPADATTITPASTTIALSVVGSPVGAANTLVAGQLVAIMQMQCADINSTDTDAYGDGVAGGVDANGGGSATAGRGYAGGYTEPAGSCLAGQYEYFRTGAGTTATSISLTGVTLTGTYVQAAATATQGRRTFQIIRMPQYANLILNANVTAPAWNGFTGGVVMLDVAQQLTWGGFTINVQSLGFRAGVWAPAAGLGTTPTGGTDDRSSATFVTLPSPRGAVFPFRAPRDAATAISGGYTTTTNANVVRGGGKGEGIAGTPTNLANGDGYPASGTFPAGAKGDRSSGAPGNAGGGGSTLQDCCRDNGGGGGGGNGGIGGRGGAGWATNGSGAAPNWTTGDLYGYGGAAFAQASTTRLVMGGGGGAGQTNDTIGTSTSAPRGGNGGGIVIVRAGSYTGTGTVNVQGESAPNNTGNDAGGGGGAAGSVLLISYAAGGSVGTVTYQAIGGNGAGSAPTQGAHGPGGGGAGGVVFTTGVTPPASAVAGGVTGVTTTPTIDGAADGRHGARSATGFSGTPVVTPPTTGCVPTVTKQYNPNPITINGTSTLTVSIANPSVADATLQQALTDPIAAPVSITTASTVALPVTTSGTGVGICANTGVVVTGSGSLGFPNGYVIPANRTCTIQVQVTSSAAGAFLNTIPDGSAVGGLRTQLTGSPIIFNGVTATDTLRVIDPTKSVRVQTDTAPLGLVNIGDTIRYTLTYSLPAGASSITGFQIWDILPSQVNPVPTGGANITVTATGAGTTATENTNYTGVAGATTSSLLTGSTLAGGGTITVTIDAVLNATATAPFNNTARAEGLGLPVVTGFGLNGGVPTDARTVAGGFPELPQTVNTTSGDPTVVSPVAAPTLTKAFDPISIGAGQTSVLTITLGNSNASAITLTQALVDNLPTNVSVAAPTGLATTCGGVPTNTATSVTLPNTSTIPTGGCTITINVTSSTLGVFTNSIPAGTVVNGLNTSAGAAPSASAPLVVIEPTKRVKLLNDLDTSGTPSIGDVIQYELIYALPAGAPNITNFQIFDILPSQVNPVPATGANVGLTVGVGSTAVENTNYTGIAGATTSSLLTAGAILATNSSITITIDTTINNTVTLGTPFNNTARGTGTGLTAVTGNGSGGGIPTDADATQFGVPLGALPQPNDTAASGEATQVTPVAPNADISVVKSQPSPAVVNSGGTITYTVTVRNNGPATAANVVVTDTLPAGSSFVSATGGGTQALGVVTWNSTTTPALLSLGNGISQVFTVVVNAP